MKFLCIKELEVGGRKVFTKGKEYLFDEQYGKNGVLTGYKGYHDGGHFVASHNDPLISEHFITQEKLDELVALSKELNPSESVFSDDGYGDYGYGYDYDEKEEEEIEDDQNEEEEEIECANENNCNFPYCFCNLD